MEQPASRNASSIDTVGKHALGYDIAQVDDFLAKAHEAYEQGNEALQSLDIDNASFNICKNGYAIDQVDAALARLQKAVIERSCVWKVQHEGKQAWYNETLDLYHAVAKVASRHAGERFSNGVKKKPSYDVRQVDRLVDDLIAKIGASLESESIDDHRKHHVQELTPELLAKMLFTQRKGKHGYSERQVDYYLGVCSQLLMRIEAYNSLQDEQSQPNMHTTSAQDQSLPLRTSQALGERSSQSGQEIASLFAADALSQQSSQALQHSAFDDVHRAEQEIFAQDAQPFENAHHSEKNYGEETRSESNNYADSDHEHSDVHNVNLYDHNNDLSANMNEELERETDPLAKTAVFEPFFEESKEHPVEPVDNVEPSYPLKPETPGERVESIDNNSSSSAEESSNSSLAALARMAEGLHSLSSSEDVSFSPVMPSLKPLSVQPLIDEFLEDTAGNSLFANADSAEGLFNAQHSEEDQTGEFDQPALSDDTGEFSSSSQQA